MFSQQSFQTAKTSSSADVYNYRQLDEKNRLHLSVRILVLFLFDVIPTCGPFDEVAPLQLLRIAFHGYNKRKRVLICFHSLIIYLTFQHHYSPNCKLYTHTKKQQPTKQKTLLWYVLLLFHNKKNFLTITGVTPNQALTLTIPTGSCWRLSNYKAWCLLLIKIFISHSFFLLYAQCAGHMLHRGG